MTFPQFLLSLSSEVRSLHVFLFLHLPLICLIAVGFFKLKKFILKPGNNEGWIDYKFPVKWFAIFLAITYFLFLPAILDELSLLDCGMENAVGVYPLGRDYHIFWLIVISPLFLTLVFQKYDNGFIAKCSGIQKLLWGIFLNLPAALLISLILLMNFAAGLFSSSWPCTIESSQ